MTRTTSATFKAAVFAQETGEAFILLITISHDDLDDDIRVCSDGQQVTSNSLDYEAFPFQLTLPEVTEDGPPRARLVIDNVDKQIVEAVRTITTPPTVKIELVLASDPDTVEASFDDFVLRNIQYDMLTVQGELLLEVFETEPFPSAGFYPSNFPGLF